MDYIDEIDKRIHALQTELTKLTIARDVLTSISPQRRQPPSLLDQRPTPRVVTTRKGKRTDVQGEVLRILTLHDGTPMRSPEVASLLQWTDKRVQNVLYNLRKKGVVERDGQLAYYIIHSQERIAS